MGVHLRKRGRFFHIDIHRLGRRIRRTLKIVDRKQAEFVRSDFDHQLLGGLWNVGLAVDTGIERAIEKYRKEYEEFHHSVSSRAHTRLTFGRFLESIRASYGDRATLDTIRPNDIEFFQKSLLEKTSQGKRRITPPSVNRSLREISGLFSWAMNRGLCRTNPCMKVKPFREIRRLVEPASLAEVRKLVRQLPETYADLVRIILYTGLRLGEALHLRREDVSFETRLLFVKSRPDYLVKDREERALRLPPPAMKLFRQRRKQLGRTVLYFPSESNAVIDNRNALRVLHEGCKKAGIRRFNWKLLRKTFTTLQGKTLRPWELRAVLGHSDIRTTDKHYMLLAARDCRLRSLSI